MSNGITSLKLSFEFNPESGLQPLGLSVPDPGVLLAMGNAYGAICQAAGAGQDYTASPLAQPLYDAILLAVASAMGEGGMQFINIHDAANGHIQQLQGQIQSATAELQQLQASFEQACQNAAQDGYAQGLAAGQQVAANTPTGGNSAATGGFLLNIDTKVLAEQIASYLSNDKPAVQVTNNVAGANPAGGMTLGAGGLNLGNGVQLGKPKAAQGSDAQPVTATGAKNAEYDLDPATIGGGIGSGGGLTNTSKAGEGKTVKGIRGDSSLEKIGLPTAKKKFAGGAVVYIVPSSDNAQWDDRAPVVADPKEGGNLEEIAEGAKTILMKSLHYYSEV